MDTVEILKGSSLSDDEYLKAAILGWSVELVSALGPLPFSSIPRAKYRARGAFVGVIADPP